MSRVLFVLLLLCVVFLSTFGQGSTPGTAATLALGGSASASMSDAARDHYWKITTTANGYLRVEINSATTIDVDVRLLDVDGTTSIMSDGRSGTYSEVFGFLKPGTYYVHATRWSGTTGTYTISNSFTAPPRNADAETNDTPATANSLAPTGVSTGHLGFYGNQSTDLRDYWKITTTQNGWLRVQVRSDSLDSRGGVLDFDVRMYDVDGATSISSDGRAGTFSQVARFLRPGTYYVEVFRWSGNAGSYQITSDFFPPPLANDAEGNDTWQTATSATLNGTVTGNIGYYSNGTTDTEDYWKFTTTGNGKVVVQVTSDSLDRSGVEMDLDVVVRDIDGVTGIVSDGRTGKFSECVAYVRPGTFYVRVYLWAGNAGSYSLTITHTPPRLANDVEGNDSPATATLLTYGVTSSGHIGYYANGTTDTQDFWRLTAPSSDSTYIHVTSDAELDLDLTLLASDGTTVVGSDGQSGMYSRVGFRPTAGSVYYARVSRWSGTAGSYSILATRSSVVNVERTEEAIVPTEFALYQNYPNPFNPVTTIRYAVPKEGKVRIAVYSILGQEVAVLQEGVQNASYHTVSWNGKNSRGVDVPSGVYLIRMQADDKQIVKKAVLLR